jgi:2-dehydropantoate 2-reductase
VRVLVMGSGGLGGYYGGSLAQRGHDVTFVARGAHLAALRERGLEIRAGEERTLLRPVKAVGSPAEAGTAFDLILFTVKGYDAEAAAVTLRPAVGSSTAVFSLLNGIDSIEQLRAALGPEHVLAGTTVISAMILEPGVIALNSPFRRIEMAELCGQQTARLEAIAEAFREASVEVTVSTDPRLVVWQKFVPQAPLASLTSACQATVGEIRAVPQGAALFATLVDETIAVGRALGIALPADAAEAAQELFMGLPDTHKTSMQRDFERGSRTEVEQLTGAVVRRARELGVPTPAFDVLYAILKVRSQA